MATHSPKPASTQNRFANLHIVTGPPLNFGGFFGASAEKADAPRR